MYWSGCLWVLCVSSELDVEDVGDWCYYCGGHYNVHFDGVVRSPNVDRQGDLEGDLSTE